MLLRLGTHLHRLQFQNEPGFLQGLDRIFSCEFPHHKCQLPVRGEVDWGRIHARHVGGGAIGAFCQFHDNLMFFMTAP